MYAPLHAAPKNHLLGKHPFPPCLFYVWPINCPRKTMRISSAVFCLHPSCGWVCISCIQMGRWTQDRRVGLTWPQSRNSMHDIHKASSVILETRHCFYHLTCYFTMGTSFEHPPPGLPITNSLGTTRIHCYDFNSFQVEVLQAVLLLSLCLSSAAASKHEAQWDSSGRNTQRNFHTLELCFHELEIQMYAFIQIDICVY